MNRMCKQRTRAGKPNQISSQSSQIKKRIRKKKESNRLRVINASKSMMENPIKHHFLMIAVMGTMKIETRTKKNKMKKSNIMRSMVKLYKCFTNKKTQILKSTNFLFS